MRGSEIIQKAIELGRTHGFVTCDQLDELLQTKTEAVAPEEIEALLGAALSDEGINVSEENQRLAGGARPLRSAADGVPSAARSLHENRAGLPPLRPGGFRSI